MLFQDHIDYIKSQPLQQQQAYSLYIDNCKALDALIQQAEANKRPYKKAKEGCRVMTLCFRDGQQIRHKKSLPTEWVGTFQKATGTILCKGVTYYTLGQFAMAHYKAEKSSRTTVYGWGECECEVDGKWVSTLKLPELA